MNSNLPTHAIVAVTLNCNSRCVMCDIWKNRIHHELLPRDYLKLPSSLKDINITGGEPFLRMDLPEIITAIKNAAPKARLILNTNGFLPKIIERQIPKILKIDPKFAVRVSLDGWEETHDEIRKIPRGFNLAIESITILRKQGIRDLGICFTIMERNIKDLSILFKYAKRMKLEFAITLVADSPIYFGENKQQLAPQDKDEVQKVLNRVICDRFHSLKPKDWFRGWFESQMLRYYLSHVRPLTCDAGKKFFYLDSVGNIFTCNIKNWLMGNIKTETFEKLWNSQLADKMRLKSAKCNDCWLICSAKSGMRSKILQIGGEVLWTKMSTLI